MLSRLLAKSVPYPSPMGRGHPALPLGLIGFAGGPLERGSGAIAAWIRGGRGAGTAARGVVPFGPLLLHEVQGLPHGSGRNRMAPGVPSS